MSELAASPPSLERSHLPSFPYPGLRPFRTDESAIFFGRGEQIAEMLTRLEDHRFLAVVGASGCGKSSLVRAGLLPALEGGFLATENEEWRFVVMQPRDAPLRNLASALLKSCQPSSTGGPDETEPDPRRVAFAQASLRSGPLGLVKVTQDCGLSNDTNVLVLVDQFEELFRFRDRTRGEAASRDEAAAFVSLLLGTAEQRENPIYVVVTMRSDFLGDCDAFFGLPEAINNSQFLTPRMTRNQARDAIVEPSRLFGGDVEPLLVNHILNEIGDDPDQLPLMQHALMRAWRHAKKSRGMPVTIEPDDYNNLGGLQKALSNHADFILEHLPDDRDRRLAAFMFRGLCDRGAEQRFTRRPATVAEIAAVAGVSDEVVIRVADAFRTPGRSMLMPPIETPLQADSKLDISHESLIRQWDTLQKWLDEEQSSARIYRRLSETASLHYAPTKEADVYRPPDLDIALKWRDEEQPTTAWASRYDDNFDQSMRFLEASRDANERRMGAVVFAFVVVCVLALAAFLLWQNAIRSENMAIQAKRSAEAAKEETEEILAVNQVALAHSAMLNGAVENAKWILDDISGKGDQNDRSHLLGWEWNYSRSVYDPLFQPKHEFRFSEQSLTSLAISLDGTQLLAGDEGGAVHLWKIETNDKEQKTETASPVRSAKVHSESVSAVAFSRDGKRFASAGNDGQVCIDGEPFAKLGQVTQLAFVDQSRLVTVSVEQAASPSGPSKSLLQNQPDSIARDLGPNPRGESVSIRITTWNVAEQNELSHFVLKSKPIQYLRVSPNAKWIVVGEGLTWGLFDLASGRQIERVTVDQNQTSSGEIQEMVFHPGNRWLAAKLLHGDVAFYYLSPDGRVTETQSFRPEVGYEDRNPNREALSARVAVSTDGGLLADSGSEIGIVDLRPVTGHNLRDTRSDTTRKVALCIGINEYTSIEKLHTCVNDANGWREWFSSQGFETRSLLDASATREAILNAIERLAREAQSGDIIAVQYSGHGASLPDTSGDEADGRDEAIVPVDFRQGGFVLDDELRRICEKFPKDVSVTFFIDCAHGGTLTDEAPNVVAFSACQDDELSWDVENNGNFTLSALKVLRRGGGMSNREFIDQVSKGLTNQRQTPKLWAPLNAVDSPLLQLTREVGWEGVKLDPVKVSMIPNRGNYAAMQFSADGRTLIAASTDGVARIWRIPRQFAGDVRMDTKEPKDDVALNATGTTIAVVGENLELWDALTGRLTTKYSFSSHAPSKRLAVFDPKNQWLAVANGTQGNVELFNPITAERLASPPGAVLSCGASISSLAVSRNGKFLVAGSMGNLTIWEPQSGWRKTQTDVEMHLPECLAIDEQEGRLLSGGMGGVDLRGCLAIFENGKLLCSGALISPEIVVAPWSALEGKECQNLTAVVGLNDSDGTFSESAAVIQLRDVGGFKVLVLQSRFADVKPLRIANGTVIGESESFVAGASAQGTGITVSVYRNTIYVTGMIDRDETSFRRMDQRIGLLEEFADEMNLELPGGPGPFPPSGGMVKSELLLVDLNAKKVVRTFVPKNSTDASDKYAGDMHCSGLVFSPDGTNFYSSDHQSIYVWDVVDGQQFSPFRNQDDIVRMIPIRTFQDGQAKMRLATASNFGTLSIWNPITGSSILTLRPHRDYSERLVSPQDGANDTNSSRVSLASDFGGLRIAAVDTAGSIQVWESLPQNKVQELDEALRWTNRLFADHLLRDDVIEVIQHSSKPPSEKDLALRLTRGWNTSSESLLSATLSLLTAPDLPEATVKLASDRAGLLAAKSPALEQLFVKALAQYRLGQYERSSYNQALETLAELQSAVVGNPKGVMPNDSISLLRCMCHMQLGDHVQAWRGLKLVNSELLASELVQEAFDQFTKTFQFGAEIDVNSSIDNDTVSLEVDIPVTFPSPLGPSDVDVSVIVNGVPAVGSFDANSYRVLNLPQSSPFYEVRVSLRVRSREILNQFKLGTIDRKDWAAAWKQQPRLHLFVVGNDAYPEAPLKMAVNDAQAMHVSLASSHYQLVTDAAPILNATKSDLENRFAELEAKFAELKSPNPNDLVIFYFSGKESVTSSGYRADVGSPLREFGFMTVDPTGGGLAWSQMRDRIGNFPCRTLTIVDSCHAGLIKDYEEAQAEKGRPFPGFLLLGCGADELAWEQNGHGVFTSRLLQGLQGLADSSKDGTVMLSELIDFVRDKMPSTQQPVAWPEDRIKQYDLPLVTVPSQLAPPLGR